MTISEFRIWRNRLRTLVKQLLCWHDYGDMYQMRALRWGSVIEDKYECCKCHKVWWKRRRIYKDGSWIK